MTHQTLSVAAFALLVSGAVAQGTVTVPSIATNAEGNRSVTVPFGYDAFRSQHVIDGHAIANSNASITGLTLRAELGNSTLPALSYANVTVKVGHTALASGAISTTFANNVTGPMTTVYAGPLTVTAQPGLNDAGPRPWAIAIPFSAPYSYVPANGSLLVDITAGSGAGSWNGWSIDAATTGGGAYTYGNAGRLSGGDNLSIVTNNYQGSGLTLGGNMDFAVTTSFRGYPGSVFLLGFDDLALPLDFLGAPANWMLVNSIVDVPLSFQRTFIGYAAQVGPFPIPQDIRLIGQSLYGQGIILDSAANNAGIVGTQGMALMVGDTAALPMTQVTATDSTATTGTRQMASQASGGAVLRLEGTFN